VEAKIRILQTSYEMFCRHGIRSVTMDEIATKMGISKKTLYQFFSDKKSLVTAVAEYDMERHCCLVGEIWTTAENAIDMLLRMSQHFLQDISSINPTMIVDVQRLYPEAWQKFKEKKNELFANSFVQTLIEGKQKGLFREDMNPEIMAKLRLAEIELAFNPDVFPFDKYSLIQVHTQFFFHFLYGICTDKGLALVEHYLAKKTSICTEN